MFLKKFQPDARRIITPIQIINFPQSRIVLCINCISPILVDAVTYIQKKPILHSTGCSRSHSARSFPIFRLCMHCKFRTVYLRYSNYDQTFRIANSYDNTKFSSFSFRSPFFLRPLLMCKNSDFCSFELNKLFPKSNYTLLLQLHPRGSSVIYTRCTFSFIS